MESSDFTIPFLEVKPSLMRGCGIVQIVKDQRCSAVCALAFYDSPFGRFEECASFEYGRRETRRNSQLFGISSSPKLSRSVYPLIDNSHFLAQGSMRVATRQNYNEKICMVLTAQSELELLRFEIAAERTSIILPLLTGSLPSKILGCYAEKRFGSFHMLRGKMHRCRILSESFSVNTYQQKHIDSSLLKLTERISEEFPQDFLSPSNQTYIIDDFSLIIPERDASRIFELHKNKRVASNFACDS